MFMVAERPLGNGLVVTRVLADNGSCYPYGPQPTASLNAFTAHSPRTGPTPATTTQKPNAGAQARVDG